MIAIPCSWPSQIMSCAQGTKSLRKVLPRVPGRQALFSLPGRYPGGCAHACSFRPNGGDRVGAARASVVRFARMHGRSRLAGLRNFSKHRTELSTKSTLLLEQLDLNLTFVPHLLVAQPTNIDRHLPRLSPSQTNQMLNGCTPNIDARCTSREATRASAIELFDTHSESCYPRRSPRVPKLSIDCRTLARHLSASSSGRRD